MFSRARPLFQTLFSPDQLDEEVLPSSENCYELSQPCNYTAECCRTEDDSVVTCNDNSICERIDNTQVEGGIFALEPFCLAWSKASSSSGSTTIDTLAFAPREPWPPIKPLPLVKLLPLCPLPFNSFSDTTLKCKFCDYVAGMPIATISFGKAMGKLTVQW